MTCIRAEGTAPEDGAHQHRAGAAGLRGRARAAPPGQQQQALRHGRDVPGRAPVARERAAAGVARQRDAAERQQLGAARAAAAPQQQQLERGRVRAGQD